MNMLTTVITGTKGPASPSKENDSRCLICIRVVESESDVIDQLPVHSI
jgi:hypothetical protein